MQKASRNDKCNCGSKKKYKNCCMNTVKIDTTNEFKKGGETTDEIVIEIIKEFNDRFKDHKVLDLTDKLNGKNYKNYQIANYYDKTIMIAIKTEKNKSVFDGRVNNENSDIIVMYHGSYKTFESFIYQRYMEDVCSMIK